MSEAPIDDDLGAAPGRPLLVWDGECDFCLASLEWLHARLPVWPVAQPWQQLDLGALGLDEPTVRAAVQLVERDGRTLAGSDAAARLLRAQPAPGWRLLGRALGAPGLHAIGAAGYRWVARNRSHLRWLTAVLRRTSGVPRELDRPARIARIAVPHRATGSTD